MKSQNPFFIISVMGLLTGLTAFAIDMNLPAIPEIARDLGDTMEQVQLSISVFLLFFSIGQLLYGPISDSVGRKKVINTGLILFAVACLAITQVTTYQHLLIWRIVQALGGAAVSISVVASLRDMYSGNQLAKMTSYLAMTMSVAPMIAPFIGAILLAYFSWHSIFVALFLLCITGGLLYNFGLSESLEKENRNPFKVAKVLSRYTVVMRDRQSVYYILILALSSTPMFIFVTCSPLVYMEYLGIPSQKYPLFFAVNVVAMMAHSWLNTRLLGYFDYTRVLAGGVRLALIPGSLLLLVSLLLPKEQLLLGMVPLTALTIGLGVLINANASAGLMTRHARNAGSAASFSGTARFGSGAIAGLLVNIFSTGNHLPMIIAIFLCTLVSVLVYQPLARLQALPQN